MVNPWIELLVWLPGVLVAISFHEAAHAMIADYLGDPTPRRLGRVSLNPLVHLDLIGTLLLVLVHFGWGKPVPVDPTHLRNPRRDLVWISLAGPLANLLTAGLFGLILRLSGPSLLAGDAPELLIYSMLRGLVLISLLLAFFNLLPLPPLDGSKILSGLLPLAYARHYVRHAGMLSWGLIAIILLERLTEISILGPLIYTPSGWLYKLLVGPLQF